MKIKFIDGPEKEFVTLAGADLRGADLRRADLYGADLYGADLRGANLCAADLRGANLCRANLRGADLPCANLYGADLYGADLRCADLRNADLRNTNLGEADLKILVSSRTIVGAGVLRVFKELKHGVVCELEIPADAGRVGGVIGRKCRAEFARVITGEGHSNYDPGFFYRVGEVVRPDAFDPNPLVECSGGIHFFITREEAEAY